MMNCQMSETPVRISPLVKTAMISAPTSCTLLFVRWRRRSNPMVMASPSETCSATATFSGTRSGDGASPPSYPSFAQVAAAAGYRVKLYDTRFDAVSKALLDIGKMYAKLAEKGV